MIELRHSGSTTEVHVICDTCGERIADAKKGLVVWRESEDWSDPGTGFRLVHKGRCDQDRAAGSIELLTLPVFLARGLGIASDEDWEVAKGVAFGHSALA